MKLEYEYIYDEDELEYEYAEDSNEEREEGFSEYEYTKDCGIRTIAHYKDGELFSEEYLDEYEHVYEKSGESYLEVTCPYCMEGEIIFFNHGYHCLSCEKEISESEVLELVDPDNLRIV